MPRIINIDNTKPFTTTYFGLMAEFGSAHIPIVDIGRKYFGYDERKAKNEAAKGGYPFPVFRVGGQKTQWMVDVADLSAYLDKIKEKAKAELNAAS